MTRKARIVAIITIFIITSIGVCIYIGIYNRPHINVSESSPDLSMKSSELLDDFLTNETQANSKYLEQIIQVTGIVSEITTNKEGNGIIAMNNEQSFGSIMCHLLPDESKKITEIKKGQSITIKGICTGYLMDVILVKCVIVNQ